MKRKKQILIIAIFFFCAVLLEGFAYFCLDRKSYVDYTNRVLYEAGGEITRIQSYERTGDAFLPVGEDPQLIWELEDQISKIHVDFGETLGEDVAVQAYFRTDEYGFDEEKSFVITAPRGSDSLVIEGPGILCHEMRLDIDGSFSLGKVTLENCETTMVYEGRVQLLRMLFVGVLLNLIFWAGRFVRRKIVKTSLNRAEWVYLSLCFLFYFVWACLKPLNFAPDEYMRYDVTAFLYENNRLPAGMETISQIWGFSYAHTPTMLCHLLAYIPMKLVGMYTKDAFALLVAARLVSVLCGVGTVLMTIKVAKRLFGKPVYWVVPIFVSMLPQFIFLSSYVNNDIVAVFGTSLILYAWVDGIRDKWGIRNAVILSMGISVCGLAYYNSWGWILCSMIFFGVTYIWQNPKNYKGLLKLGGLISIIVLLCISYLFIRHLVLYGDLLGFDVTRSYGELYALDSCKPSARLILQQEGESVLYMLLGRHWLEQTLNSFIGSFGYGEITLNEAVYVLYKGLFAVAALGAVISLFVGLQKKDKLQLLLTVSLILCIVIPVGLSMYYSYTSDFQPQGRYCYSALLGIALFLGVTMESLWKKIKEEKYRYLFIGGYGGVMTATTMAVFFYTYLPA